MSDSRQAGKCRASFYSKFLGLGNCWCFIANESCPAPRGGIWAGRFNCHAFVQRPGMRYTEETGSAALFANTYKFNPYCGISVDTITDSERKFHVKFLLKFHEISGEIYSKISWNFTWNFKGFFGFVKFQLSIFGDYFGLTANSQKFDNISNARRRNFKVKIP